MVRSKKSRKSNGIVGERWMSVGQREEGWEETILRMDQEGNEPSWRVRGYLDPLCGE